MVDRELPGSLLTGVRVELSYVGMPNLPHIDPGRDVNDVLWLRVEHLWPLTLSPSVNQLKEVCSLITTWAINTQPLCSDIVT